MKNIPFMKSIKHIAFVSLFYLIIITTILISPLEVNVFDFIFEGLFTYFGIVCFILSWRLRNNVLSIGWIFLSISLFADTLDEFEVLKFYEWQDILFEKIFFGIGFILVIFGFHLILLSKKKILEKLEYAAHNDPLTNLPNKKLLTKQFQDIIDTALGSNKQIGVMFIDLDKFKLVNNTFGHTIGDELLKQVADRLKLNINNNNLIARLSGDEFIVVLSDILQLGELNDVVKEVQNIFANPFILNEKQIHISCSIGMTLFPDHGKDIETLFSNADMAVHKAKANGGNQCTFFNEEMHKQCQRKLLVKENLQQALKKKEFVLHYQPKVDILTGEVTGLEALVRWQRSNGKLSYPGEFIEIAEETGIIKEIDLNVLELACLQIKEWMDRGIQPLNIAVNFSAKLFNTLDFIEKIDSILKCTEIDPSYLSIEITETEGIEDVHYVCNIMKQLKMKKIKIALDDFGTGYSSLNYLKIFPIDSLKIDKIFIDGITKDERDKSLLNAAIMMTKVLEIRVVCEGVETSEQLNILKTIGCNEYQGYYYSKPLPIELIEEKLIV